VTVPLLPLQLQQVTGILMNLLSHYFRNSKDPKQNLQSIGIWWKSAIKWSKNEKIWFLR